MNILSRSPFIAGTMLLMVLPIVTQDVVAQTPAQMEYERQQREYRLQMERQQQEQQRQQQIMNENARRQQEESRRQNAPIGQSPTPGYPGATPQPAPQVGGQMPRQSSVDADALRKLQPLAAKGEAWAQNDLGVMYGKGQGVAQNYAEAVKWWRLAAAQGYAEAQHNLGLMYQNGQGVAQNHAEALKWYRLGAAQGNTEAQNNLGIMYGTGQGVAQDYVRAYMWINLAAAKGNGDAVRNREFAAKKMTPQQIAEAQKLMRECQARQFKGCD